MLSETAIHPDLLVMMLADARLPVAGHTQSGTVEAALAHGLTATDVPGYLRTRLSSVTAVEAGTAVVARSAAAVDDVPGVRETEGAWAARTPSAAVRDASRTQGRALLRLAHRLWPHSPALAAADALGRPSRAVVLGAIAAEVGLGAPALAHLVGYDDVQTVCAASLKLVPLDPTEVTCWVYGALPDVAALAEQVAHLCEPEDIPALGCPQIEVWAEAHAVTTRRLFRA